MWLLEYKNITGVVEIDNKGNNMVNDVFSFQRFVKKK